MAHRGVIANDDMYDLRCSPETAVYNGWVVQCNRDHAYSVENRAEYIGVSSIGFETLNPSANTVTNHQSTNINAMID